MKLIDLKPGAKIHFMGICGTAMASLAGLLQERIVTAGRPGRRVGHVPAGRGVLQLLWSIEGSHRPGMTRTLLTLCSCAVCTLK